MNESQVSYAELSADDQAHFRALGVLALDASFDTNLLAALWQMPPDQAGTVAHRLHDLALIDLMPGANRYSQTPLLREYARTLLMRHNEGDAAFDRYADFVIQFTAQFRTLPPEAWAQFTLDLPHVDTIGAELVQQYQAHPDDAIAQQRTGDFMWNAAPYLKNHPAIIETPSGSVRRSVNWLQYGLSVYMRQGSHERTALTLVDIGAVWDSLGHKMQALNFYGQAIPFFRKTGDSAGEATLHTNISRQVGGAPGEVTTLSRIGQVWSIIGENQQALGYYEQALALFRQAGDKHGEATTLSSIGLMWDELGDKRKALGSYDQALPLRRQRRQVSESTALVDIDIATDEPAEKHKALDFYHQALSLFRQAGETDGEAATLSSIGLVWDDLGDKHKALDFYHQALPLFQRVGDKAGEALTLKNISWIFYDEGDMHTAIRHLAGCIDLEAQVQHPRLDIDRQRLARWKAERNSQPA